MAAQPDRLRALLFDFDGTIAETETLHHRAFNLAFDELGLGFRWPLGHYRALLAIAGGRERLHYDLGQRPDAAALLARIEEIHQTKTRHFRALAQENALPMRPGVARLIAEAEARDVRIGIVTTTSRPVLDDLMTRFLGEGALARFSPIVTGEMTEKKKPAPDGYLTALKRLAEYGIPPAATIAIEDSNPGITAARRAGVAVVATPCAFTAHEDHSAAALVVSDLGEPDAPAKVIAGPPLPRDIVDIDALDRLVEPSRSADPHC